MPSPPRLTLHHVRLVHRDLPDAGPIPGFSHFNDADYEELTEAYLAERSPGPIAVFSYGSLMWRPEFQPYSVRRGKALGWQRSFCLKLLRWRGTAEVPGLMMQIDRGDTCEGVLQTIDPAAERATLDALWRREMSIKPPGNHPRWIEVESDGQIVRAIAFTANPESPFYAGPMSPEDVAKTLAIACGHLGSGAEYLYQTVSALEAHGIHDPYLWDLQERVAGLIEQRFPEACLA